MKNKFIIGRKVLSDSEIGKHKDFTSLYRSYQTIKRPLYKTTRFITGISVAAAAIVIFVLYFSFFRNSTFTNTVNPPEKAMLSLNSKLLPQKVAPPLEGIRVPHQSFHLKGSKGGAIKTSSGTEISVPANAFIDKEGNTVSGEVEIRYREFNNPLDFFLSGIPMHQVTEGQVVRTESAGMFEILAFQHDQSLTLDKDKTIGVELLSFFPGELNCYYLDTLHQQWMNRGESQLVAENGQAIAVRSEMKYNVDTTGMPVVPRKADKKKFVFNINVDVSGFPELTGYKGLLFEVNETYKKFDEQLYDNKWDKATLTASKVPSNYDLTLSIRDTSVTIMVYPVFNNKNYEEAVRVYQEKKEVWLAQQKNNEKNVANQQEKAKKENNIEPRAISGTNVLAFGKMKPLGKRHVKVNLLGIYQCGQPLSNEDMKNIRPVITDMNGSPVTNAVLYLAEREHNSLSCFGQSEVISYRQGVKNLFWAVTKDGKIGILDPESFAALTGKDDAPGFKMKFVDSRQGVALLKDALQI